MASIAIVFVIGANYWILVQASVLLLYQMSGLEEGTFLRSIILTQFPQTVAIEAIGIDLLRRGVNTLMPVPVEGRFLGRSLVH